MPGYLYFGFSWNSHFRKSRPTSPLGYNTGWLARGFLEWIQQCRLLLLKHKVWSAAFHHLRMPGDEIHVKVNIWFGEWTRKMVTVRLVGLFELLSGSEKGNIHSSNFSRNAFMTTSMINKLWQLILVALLLLTITFSTYLYALYIVEHRMRSETVKRVVFRDAFHVYSEYWATCISLLVGAKFMVRKWIWRRPTLR